ncbi:UNVERIFIED_CONTAM: hypothetical protein HDU68_008040 [Siphonaria sp. JEL0065]|nr:hypothetical protein HDU68_008040 [Siphonaria sp. JEL0065]
MLKWFSKHDEDYAEVLQGIEDDIKRTEEDMVAFVALSNEWQGAILKYAGSLYLVYLAAYFTVLSPVGDSAATWLAKVAVLTLVPVGIYYARVLVDVWYKAKIRTNGMWFPFSKYASELICFDSNKGRKLDTLRSNQKLKVEELKKKTGYYTTKNLLDKFDTPPKQLRPPTTTPKKKGPQTPGGIPQNPMMQTPNRNPGTNGSSTNLQQQQQQELGGDTPFSTPGPMPGTSNQLLQNANVPSIQVQGTPSGQSSWFDRVMDAVVGDSEGPQNKYALICQSCFEHNGLVPPEQYHNIKFKCRTCNHLNAPHQYQYGVSMSRSGSTDSNLREMAGSPTPFARGPLDQSVGYVSDSGVSQRGFGGPGFGVSGGEDVDSRAGSPVPPQMNEDGLNAGQGDLEGQEQPQFAPLDSTEAEQHDADGEGDDEDDRYQIQGDSPIEKENVPSSDGRQLRKRK